MNQKIIHYDLDPERNRNRGRQPLSFTKVQADRLLEIFKKRNKLIKELHAYHKFTVEELAAAFRLSRSGIYYILNNRNEYGDYKPCKACKTLMWQEGMDWHDWKHKEYCCSHCEEMQKKKDENTQIQGKQI